MLIAKIDNGTITVGDYRELFPNTGFTANGPGDEWLSQNNCKKVNMFKEHNRLTQKLSSCAPYDDGEFVSIVEVADMSAEEIQSAKDSAMANIRSQRNLLLSGCDWTQIADSTADKQAWAAYRQELRDLPAKVDDARTFTDWPHDPNWVEPTGSV